MIKRKVYKSEKTVERMPKALCVKIQAQMRLSAKSERGPVGFSRCARRTDGPNLMTSHRCQHCIFSHTQQILTSLVTFELQEESLTCNQKLQLTNQHLQLAANGDGRKGQSITNHSLRQRQMEDISILDYADDLLFD